MAAREQYPARAHWQAGTIITFQLGVIKSGAKK
jgi:hypothetical protein